MKLVEAMKEVKYNKVKIADLEQKIQANCARLSYETPQLGTEEETVAKVRSWVQSALDLSMRNLTLLCAIQRTNLATMVTIDLSGRKVTHSIAWWVWRRREYIKIEQGVLTRLNDRGLREQVVAPQSTGQPTHIKIVRHFDVNQRDELLSHRADEIARIDAALEIANVMTDLVEESTLLAQLLARSSDQGGVP